MSAATLVGKYCGSNQPEDIHTTGGTAVIELKTDDSIQFQGFRILYGGRPFIMRAWISLPSDWSITDMVKIRIMSVTAILFAWFFFCEYTKPYSPKTNSCNY